MLTDALVHVGGEVFAVSFATFGTIAVDDLEVGVVKGPQDGIFRVGIHRQRHLLEVGPHVGQFFRPGVGRPMPEQLIRKLPVQDVRFQPFVFFDRIAVSGPELGNLVFLPIALPHEAIAHAVVRPDKVADARPNGGYFLGGQHRGRGRAGLRGLQLQRISRGICR